MAFYSEQLLHRKSGRFGKIWMAATNVMKLNKKEVVSVNVVDCCNQVLEYVEWNANPRGQGGKHPRLSLYLSAFLMYGIIKIYNKQCEYLLAEAKAGFLRLQHLLGLQTGIDLKDLPKADHVTNPECLPGDMDAYEFYMVMEELDRQDIPLPPCEVFALESLSSQPSSTQSKKSKRKSRKEKRPEPLPGSPHTVASIEQITLIEPPPVLIDTPLSPIPVPKDIELPTMNGQDIDLQLHPDEPPLSVKDLLPASTPIRPPSPPTSRSTRSRSTRDQQTTEQSPTRVQQTETEKTPEPTQPPHEVPVTQAVPRSPEITQILKTPLPRRRQSRKSLRLDPAEPKSPTRKRHKRQLKFADAVTQIPKLQIKKNMTCGRDTSETFHLVDVKGAESTDWMTVPGRREFREEPLSLLWSRNARFRRGLRESELPQLESSESESSSKTGSGPPLPEEQRSRQSDQGYDYVAARLQLAEEERAHAELSTEVPQQEPRPAEESIEVLRQISATAERLEISEIEMPSVEVARDASTSRILEPEPLNLSDIIPADDSMKKAETSASKRRSRSASSRRSTEEIEPQAALSHSTLQASTLGQRSLYDIVEEPRFVDHLVPIPDLLEQEPAEGAHREEELLKTIQEEIEHQSSKKTTFRKLCPPQHFTKREAVRRFTTILGLCAKGAIKATQKTSFGEIYIIENRYV